MSQVFRVHVLLHGLRFCVRCVIIALLLYPAYECCGLSFVLSNSMDVNMNTIITRIHLARGSPNNVYASSLMSGLIVLHCLICARSSEYRPERGLQARSGKYCIISDPRAGPAGHDSGPPAGSCKFGKRRIRGSDSRVCRKHLVGYGDPTRE